MKELKCTVCERGCILHADMDLYEISVSGNECPRGREYALGEYASPVRTAVFNVRVRGGAAPVVAARTARPVAVNKILPLSRLLAKLEVAAPVREGQTLFAALLGESLTAVSSVGRKEK